MRVEAKTRLYPNATRAITEPTVSPETRIWTALVTSVDLAFLAERPISVLGALGAPVALQHAVHDVGVGALAGLQGRAHELRGTGREAAERGAPFVTELIAGVGGGRPRLALEGDDDEVVLGLGEVALLGEAERHRREFEGANGLEGVD